MAYIRSNLEWDVAAATRSTPTSKASPVTIGVLGGRMGEMQLQRVLIVNVNDYAFVVPFIESEDVVFLKTVIPSRRATKKYLGDS